MSEPRALWTVTGPLEVPDEGVVLVHEHLIIDYAELLGREPEPVGEAKTRRLVNALIRARDSGVSVLVDCTPPHYGRRLDVMKAVSISSGVPVVASTGSFCEEWAPLPRSIVDASEEELADRFREELLEGSGPEGIRAGVIKAATGSVISEQERKILLAAGKVQAEENVPIVSHTTAGLGPEQLDIYERRGADPSRILISHVGFEESPADYAALIAARGAYVGLDRIGHHHFYADDHWLRLIIELGERGHFEKVVLSHDAVTHFAGPDEIAGHTFSDYSYIPGTFLEKLIRSGMSNAELRLLTVDNPLSWLSGTASAR